MSAVIRVAASRGDTPAIPVVDPPRVDAHRRRLAVFDAALARRTVPVRSRPFAFGGAMLSYYLVPADGRETERRPTVILVGGHDAMVVDAYLALAAPALRRGYHCALFEGPGRGRVPPRPDSERVAAALIEELASSPIVDVTRMVLHGWGLGGLLALRAAAGDPCIAACIVEPSREDAGDAPAPVDDVPDSVWNSLVRRPSCPVLFTHAGLGDRALDWLDWLDVTLAAR